MKKIKKIQIARIIVQLIMLYLLPGLFIMAFSELTNIIKMTISHNFNFLQALPSLMEFIAVTIFIIIMGRVFCGWMCAFGTYNDLVYLLSKNVFKTKFKINGKMDSFLKYIKYLVLLTIIYAGSVLGSRIFSSASPWDAFAQITDFSNLLVSMPIGLLLLLLITIGAFFVERFFCRYLCPLGAFFSLISSLGLLRIRKPTDNCGLCRICTNNCSMGLKLYKKDYICGGNCINCFKCIEACPRKNTRANFLGQDVTPAFASSAAIATIVGVYSVSNLGGYMTNILSPAPSETAAVSTVSTLVPQNNAASAQENKNTTAQMQSDTPVQKKNNTSTQIKSSTSVQKNKNVSLKKNSGTSSHRKKHTTVKSSSAAAQSTTTQNTTTQSTSVQSASTQKYKDGNYTGTGIGFRGGTTEIEVTISSGRIAGINTVSSEDTPRFYDFAFQNESSEIISSQSTNVDVISGATHSSMGIISAVQDALSKAMNS